jgi:hypothetical protein
MQGALRRPCTDPGKVMMTSRRQNIIVALSLVAGGGDFVTGLLLVFIPGWTLARMGVPLVFELVFLRFVGVFVACVGASYCFGLLVWWLGGSHRRLRFAWEFTILFRVAVGAFVAAQIVGGGLLWQWSSVTVVDWSWALAQGLLLRGGLFSEVQS